MPEAAEGSRIGELRGPSAAGRLGQEDALGELLTDGFREARDFAWVRHGRNAGCFRREGRRHRTVDGRCLPYAGEDGMRSGGGNSAGRDYLGLCTICGQPAEPSERDPSRRICCCLEHKGLM